jgi:hypothetical protein
MILINQEPTKPVQVQHFIPFFLSLSLSQLMGKKKRNQNNLAIQTGLFFFNAPS